MTDLGTCQIRFPDFAISYPEPQFRADARELYEELRAKFLAGMADVYDEHAEIARQKYNAMDPATDRPRVLRDGIFAIALPARKAGRPKDGIALKSIAHPDRRPKRKAQKVATKKRAAKPAVKRDRK